MPISSLAGFTGSVRFRSTARPLVSVRRTMTVGLDRLGRLRQLGQRHVEGGLAVVVGARVRVEGLARRLDRLVGEAEGDSRGTPKAW